MDGSVLVVAVALAGAAVVVLLAIALARVIRQRDQAREAAAAATARADAAVADRESRDAADRDLLAHLPLGVVQLSSAGNVTVANEAALAILDRDRSRVDGRPIFEAFADQRIVDLVAAARSTGHAHAELATGGPDGRTILVRATGAPDRSSWLFVEDVSELRRLQRIRAEFIDNLSHELRTPLTSLGLLAETLARDVATAAASGGPVTPRMSDRIEKIQLETGFLTQMVTEMLELSRIEAGTPSAAVFDELDMGRLAETTVDRLRTFADRSAIELTADVPASPRPMARGDGDRLGQVLLNLVHNAIKFSPRGETVTIRVGVDGADVVTAVVDHGIGIPREAQSRIFERFYKVDRARARGEGGTGLGLAIARHIVEAHGGRIWVDSTEGEGATFSFALPALVPARPVEAAIGS